MRTAGLGSAGIDAAESSLAYDISRAVASGVGLGCDFAVRLNIDDVRLEKSRDHLLKPDSAGAVALGFEPTMCGVEFDPRGRAVSPSKSGPTSRLIGPGGALLVTVVAPVCVTAEC